MNLAFTDTELSALKMTTGSIAVRIGNENAGFAGDANSSLVEPNIYELWEGAGYIIKLPLHTLCVLYSDPTMVRTFAHSDFAGITQFIREADAYIMAQVD